MTGEEIINCLQVFEVSQNSWLLAPGSWHNQKYSYSVQIFQSPENILPPREYLGAQGSLSAVWWLWCSWLYTWSVACCYISIRDSSETLNILWEVGGGYWCCSLISYVDTQLRHPKSPTRGISFLYHSVRKVSVESGDGAALSEVSRLIDRPGKWGYCWATSEY